MAGTALGVRLLNEIAEAALGAHVATLRLDVTATNPFLISYYAARGFSVIAHDEIMGAAAVFLEKKLG